MYKSFKHLHVSENSRDALYLGYRINLTKTEHAILYALVTNLDKPLSDKDFCSISGLELTNKKIAYHVFQINSVAKTIGNRKLIKNKAKFGYFLNEKM